MDMIMAFKLLAELRRTFTREKSGEGGWAASYSVYLM